MKPPTRREALAALPADLRPAIDRLLAVADEQSLSVLLVGGPVRDLLLGRGIRDVDLIVEPEHGWGAPELARGAAPEGARVVAHGRFGTVRIETAAGAIDLATVRSESYAHPGALPKVASGGLGDDLTRRDFSVNALALPLSAQARQRHASLVDPGTGVRDLAAESLRVFHSESFHDDPTRALRAARLAARLGFRLARDTRTAMRDALRDGAFGMVSGERYRREVEKLFEEAREGADPVRALRLLAEWHVLPALEPGLELPRSTLAPLRRLSRAWLEPPWPARRVRAWWCGLALWLAPLGSALRRRSLARLAVSGEQARRIAGFPRERDLALRALARSRGRGAVDAVLAGFDEELLLALYASCDATLRRRIARYANEDRQRRAPVNGADLLELGLRGPAVGRALVRIRSAYLDGQLRSRDEALALAREMGRRARRGTTRRPARKPRKPQ